MSDPLAGLESDYQVLTELYRAGGSTTYLARHLQLARDVTITVVPATSDAGKTDLLRRESDVKTLIALRHPNIVPVLEGRWLDPRSFVVVRARVRGSTLDQLLSAIGAVPLLRVKSTLEQVHAALGFARANGVASRHIAPESLVFQQGSGRVLLAFDSPPARTDGRRSDDESTDVRALGRLARVMLSGRADAGDDRTSLAELRPDLPTQVAGAADELAVHGNESDVLAFFSLMAAAVGVPDVPTVIALTTSSTPVTPTESVPAVRRATVARTTIGPPPPTQRVVTPVNVVSPPTQSAAPRPRRFGTAARWGTGIGVAVVLLAVGALAVLHPYFLSSSGEPVAPAADSLAVATGDVAKKPTIAPTVVAAAPAVAADSAHPDSTTAAGVATPPVSAAGDTTTKPTTPVSTPSAPISAPPSNVTANAACASTLPADQRKCFSDAVQRADADLNHVYNALIAGFRRQARSAPDDPDPPTVDKLRAAQRAWLDLRDRSCQVVGAGIFSGRDRGQCFADRAAKRSRDLQLALDSIPPGN